MIYSSLALLTAGFVASSASMVGFKNTFSNDGHQVKVLDSAKSLRKWMIFPEQMEHHKNLTSVGKSVGVENVWADHGSLVGIQDDHKMVLIRSSYDKASKQTHYRYDQMVNDIKVFGGDFVVTTGSHGGVLHVNGHPMLTKIVPQSVWDQAKSVKVTSQEALSNLGRYLSQRAKKSASMTITEDEATELVWYRSAATRGQQGEVTLTHHIRGSAQTPFLSFDAFVSTTTGEVVHFIDKTQHVAESPFESPLPGNIKVYDESLGNELVFDTLADPKPDYPTDDEEMNVLVDTTLEVKYFYQSVSGGTYVTWRGHESKLKITYNLDISNAYFDGYAGIHFGTGFIVDDVIAHEWSHAYTGKVNGLVYEYECGALNEALSDMFGETVDILNNDIDKDDTSVMRTQYPTTCHSTQEFSNDNVPPGTDEGMRWVMGEEVTGIDPSLKDGSLRDMYKPECFCDPGTTDSPYFVCSTADSGAVHSNSGVPNRLYAVIVDGGVYADPASTTGGTVTSKGLGLTKASNLVWRAEHLLTSTSQFMDFGIALQTTCAANIGADLYVPDLYTDSSTPAVHDSSFTQDDCDQLDIALYGSGMLSDDDFCPMMSCKLNRRGEPTCDFPTCEEGTPIFHEKYSPDEMTGMDITCAYNEGAQFARVYTQEELKAKGGLTFSCLDFAMTNQGQNLPVSLSVYVDTDGGAPTASSFVPVANYTANVPNSGAKLQMLSVTGEQINLADYFKSEEQTLVLVLTIPELTEGYMKAAGLVNEEVSGTTAATYWSGPNCGYPDFYNYEEKFGSAMQWYAGVFGTA
eukprot:CAMPEP_0116924236 /NCGR_PEP_ID=MMETSP0467-20121206/23375_1 /TAXON_ID=283647 /ORGANISM="Mesodinium pulex, Strain SPMC105" /LENGTH=801 /DNA_ID=CAMNT_0004602995 /DNA_START=19 /DNA_END=2424 /DNA_ORIENTATION=-